MDASDVPRSLDQIIAHDVFASRILRLAASLPPAEVSPDLRAQADALRLMSAAGAVFGVPAAETAAVAQAAVDYLRGLSLSWVVGTGATFSLQVAPALYGALDLADAAPEIKLLRSLAAFDEAMITMSNIGSRDAPLAGEAEHFAALLAALRRDADFWADEDNAACLTARLAELGVERGDAATADVRAAMLAGRAQGMSAQGSGATAAALEDAIAADQNAFMFRQALSTLARCDDPRRAYLVALAGMQRAERSGHNFASGGLALCALDALASGALGERVRLGAMRPLVARSRIAFDASRDAVPRRMWTEGSSMLKTYEDKLARFINLSDGTSIPAVRGQMDFTVSSAQLQEVRAEVMRSCARCGSMALEMLRCSQCLAAWCANPACVDYCASLRPAKPAPPLRRYCSTACQRAHWPEHKAACRGG